MHSKRAWVPPNAETVHGFHLPSFKAVGQRQLRTSQAVSKSEAALTAVADVPLEQKSVFQLLCDMHAEK